MTPLDKLKHHVTGAIERGEAQAIAGIPAKRKQFNPFPKISGKYYVRVKLPLGVWSVLSARDKISFCKRTANKHHAEMIARGFNARIERVDICQ